MFCKSNFSGLIGILVQAQVMILWDCLNTLTKFLSAVWVWIGSIVGARIFKVNIFKIDRFGLTLDCIGFDCIGVASLNWTVVRALEAFVAPKRVEFRGGSNGNTPRPPKLTKKIENCRNSPKIAKHIILPYLLHPMTRLASYDMTCTQPL